MTWGRITGQRSSCQTDSAGPLALLREGGVSWRTAHGAPRGKEPHMPADPRYMIIGASLAGAKAAETLRAEGFDGTVVLIGAESERPYERPPLSKGFLLGKEEKNKAYVHD